MAYKTADLKKTAIKAIKEHSLYFIEDIVAYLPIGKTAFYEHFPVPKENEKNDYKELADLLTDNKVEMKVKIRSKLAKGERASELLALYRLICSPEERQSLNQSYIDHSTKGKKLTVAPEIKVYNTGPDFARSEDDVED